MLRDVITGLIWAGLAFAYFLLVMSLSPTEGRFAGEVWNLLLILGGGLAAIVFLHFFMDDARDDRRLRAFRAKMDEQERAHGKRRGKKALRLNAYPMQPACCESATSSGAPAYTAEIIPFPAHMRRPAMVPLQDLA